MFWFTAKKPIFSFANLASAKCPRFGVASCALRIRSLKNHQTNTGSFQNASMSLRFCGSKPRQFVLFPRNVARPDDADSPAPIRANTRLDDCSAAVNDVKSSRGMPSAGEGRVVERNLRFACFALRAEEDFEAGFLVSFGFVFVDGTDGDDGSCPPTGLSTTGSEFMLVAGLRLTPENGKLLQNEM
jgi:hypothetical protein